MRPNGIAQVAREQAGVAGVLDRFTAAAEQQGPGDAREVVLFDWQAEAIVRYVVELEDRLADERSRR